MLQLFNCIQINLVNTSSPCFLNFCRNFLVLVEYIVLAVRMIKGFEKYSKLVDERLMLCLYCRQAGNGMRDHGD